LVGNSEAKIPFGESLRRYEDKVKMELKEIGYEGVNWIYLAEDRDQWRTSVNTAVNCQVAGCGELILPAE
jgi:hypothetical protein